MRWDPINKDNGKSKILFHRRAWEIYPTRSDHAVKIPSARLALHRIFPQTIGRTPRRIKRGD